MPRFITAEELDRAYAAGKVHTVKINRAQAICNYCHKIAPPKTAVQLFIDGHYRGYIHRTHAVTYGAGSPA